MEELMFSARAEDAGALRTAAAGGEAEAGAASPEGTEHPVKSSANSSAAIILRIAAPPFLSQASPESGPSVGASS